MLIHTEEETEDHVDKKMKKTQNGELQRKCNCKCCKANKDSIPESFRQVLKMLAKDE